MTEAARPQPRPLAPTETAKPRWATSPGTAHYCRVSNEQPLSPGALVCAYGGPRAGAHTSDLDFLQACAHTLVYASPVEAALYPMRQCVATAVTG